MLGAPPYCENHEKLGQAQNVISSSSILKFSIFENLASCEGERQLLDEMYLKKAKKRPVSCAMQNNERNSEIQTVAELGMKVNRNNSLTKF